MNIFFKEIQKSFDLLDQKKVKQSSFMKALKYMLKIADKSEYETEEFTITADKNMDTVIALRTGNALLTITVDNNGISYMGTGPQKEDRICTINNEGYSVQNEVLEWVQRNRKK